MSSSVHEDRPSVKFRIPARRGQDPVKILGDSGYAPRQPVRHEDTWFERPQGAMLGSIVLRKLLPGGPWRMAWETTVRTGPEAERHHLWTEVDGERMWRRLERLGMHPVLTLQGTRLPMDKGSEHLALERYKVGDFLEVPKPAKNKSMRGDVSELLRKLGAGSEPELRSYRDLALAPGLPV